MLLDSMMLLDNNNISVTAKADEIQIEKEVEVTSCRPWNRTHIHTHLINQSITTTET